VSRRLSGIPGKIDDERRDNENDGRVRAAEETRSRQPYGCRAGPRARRSRLILRAHATLAERSLAGCAAPRRGCNIEPGMERRVPTSQRSVLKDHRYHDDKPVFFGHDWLKGRPKITTPNAACIDFRVANDGYLTAYRWSGESDLTKAFWCPSGPDVLKGVTAP
jgi:hypothetical protein